MKHVVIVDSRNAAPQIYPWWMDSIGLNLDQKKFLKEQDITTMKELKCYLLKYGHLLLPIFSDPHELLAIIEQKLKFAEQRRKNFRERQRQQISRRRVKTYLAFCISIIVVLYVLLFLNRVVSVPPRLAVSKSLEMDSNLFLPDFEISFPSPPEANYGDQQNRNLEKKKQVEKIEIMQEAASKKQREPVEGLVIRAVFYGEPKDILAQHGFKIGHAEQASNNWAIYRITERGFRWIGRYTPQHLQGRYMLKTQRETFHIIDSYKKFVNKEVNARIFLPQDLSSRINEVLEQYKEEDIREILLHLMTGEETKIEVINFERR